MAPEVSLATTAPRRSFAHFPWPLAGLALAIGAIGVWNLASEIGRASCRERVCSVV